MLNSYSHIMYVAEMGQFYVPQKSQNQNLVSIRANKKNFKFKKIDIQLKDTLKKSG